MIVAVGSVTRSLAAAPFAEPARGGHSAETELLIKAISQPPFSIQRSNGLDWLIRPDGRPFFSFGVCNVRMGASREEFDLENPGYAAWQHYADSNQWANATMKRLKSWGFTTIGAWSDFQILRQVPDMDV